MKNKWKLAFWIQFVVFIIAILFLIFQILDQAYTIAYNNDTFENTGRDWQQVVHSVKNKLTKSDFNEILQRFPDSADLHSIELNQLKIVFDKNNRLDSIIPIR